MNIFKIIFLLLIATLFTSHTAYAKERYPADEVTKSDTTNSNAECQCDANNDPCCIPPVGGSSTKVDTPPNKKRSDTSKCKCDPDKDRCCVPLEGTIHK